MQAVRLLILILALATNAFAAQPHVANDAIYTVLDEKLTFPFTVVTKMRFPAREVHADIDSIWLAGFSMAPGASPDDLSVAWRKESWFNVWCLGLETKLGIIPLSLEPDNVGGAVTSQMINLTNKLPEEGHVYEATLSYDPDQGYLAVGVVDTTTQEQYYNGVIQLKPLKQPLYAGVGLGRTTEAVQETIQPSMEVEKLASGLSAAGTQWRVMTMHKSGEWLAMDHLDRRNNIGIEVKTGSEWELPGQLRFYIDNGEFKLPVGELLAVKGDAFIPINTDLLPVGRYRFVMEHVVDDTIRYSASRLVSVGSIAMALEGPIIDLEAGLLKGAFVVTGDGEIPHVDFHAQVSASGQDLLSSDVSKEHTIEIAQSLNIQNEPYRIPFQIPISDQAVKWNLAFTSKATAESGIELINRVPSAQTLISGSTEALANLMRKIEKQYVEEFLLSGSPLSGVWPLSSDGSWQDIDYKNQDVGWLTATHLDRLYRMAQSYQMPAGRLYQNEALRKDIVAALHYWVEGKFRNPNWWFNEIWVPQRILDIVILMGDQIPADLKKAAVDLMRPEIDRLSTDKLTGANLVWHETNRVRLGLIDKRLDVVASAFARMAAELKVAKASEEGIQADYSFHQHGPILYSGGYGASFTADLSHIVYIARGTNLIPPTALQVYVDYILDGQQWMTRNRTFDFSALGREISRGYASGNAGYLLTVCRKLLELPNVPRRAELQAYVDRLQGSGEALRGNRYFWRSDFMTHHRDDYYISVKAASTRTVATEIGNGENLKGFHLGDGMMFIMRSGAEYDQLFSVWDWERLPGTTVEQKAHPVADNVWVNVPGAGRLAGGVSDRNYGALGLSLQRDALRAKKAWFFFDREVVALGTDITADSANHVLTTINQTRLSGDAYASTAQGPIPLASGTYTLDSTSWVYHDGIGYVFPKQSNVSVAHQPQLGSWYDINHTKSKQLEMQQVFSLWLDHGQQPVGAKYEYIIVPNVTRQQLDAYTQANGIRILYNESDRQVVWHEELKMLQVVFWQPGEVITPHGLRVAVDKPAVLLVEEQDGAVAITASTLEQMSLDLNVKVGVKENAAERTIDASFRFSGGEHKGASVSKVVYLPGR